jgi:putative oxidoreductase
LSFDDLSILPTKICLSKTFISLKLILSFGRVPAPHAAKLWPCFEESCGLFLESRFELDIHNPIHPLSTDLKETPMQLLDRLRPLALFVLRLSIGVIFVQQGYLKLFVNRAIFLKLFPSWGFPVYFTYVAGALEFFGGILLILGLFARPLGLVFAVEMAIALVAVHIPHGGWRDVHATGLVLLLGAGSFVLAAVGAGSWSVDARSFDQT